MITAGVDLSSQAAHTAACVVDWSRRERRASVRELAVNVDDAAIAQLVARVDKLGIDVPLGWPVAFAEAVAQHSRDGSWPEGYAHADTTAYRLRRTDLWAWKTLGFSPPLSVSTDRIALPAMRAAALIARLPGPVPLDGSGVVVEAYPAAALRRWGFSWRGYKHPAGAEKRRLLVEALARGSKEWLSLGDGVVDRCLSSDDALDALVAALVARAAALGLVDPVPLEDRAAARREGWIAVPAEGSFGLLGGRP
jgi:predicted nuclease with RNAse H fold